MHSVSEQADKHTVTKLILFETVCLKFVLFVVIFGDLFLNAPKWCDLRVVRADFDHDPIELKLTQATATEV